MVSSLLQREHPEVGNDYRFAGLHELNSSPDRVRMAMAETAMLPFHARPPVPP